MENKEIFDEELELKLAKIDAKKKEINEKLSKMTEEELEKYMIKSIEESVEFAKNNDIEIADC